MVRKTAEFLQSSSRLKSFLYLSVGVQETEQIRGGFAKMVEMLKQNRRKNFRWVADQTSYSDHRDNVLISTSKALAEWGKALTK